MSRSDVDAWLDECDDVLTDWAGSTDSATWAADGSHETDTSGWSYYDDAGLHWARLDVTDLYAEFARVAVAFALTFEASLLYAAFARVAAAFARAFEATRSSTCGTGPGVGDEPG